MRQPQYPLQRVSPSFIANIFPKLEKAGIVKVAEMPGRLHALFGTDVANSDFVSVL